MKTVFDREGRRVLNERVRDQVRLRAPRTLALYQQTIRPRITGERHHLEVSGWVDQGIELMRVSGALGVRFEGGRAWFEDLEGFLWAYQGGLSGTGTWAEHGEAYEREETALMADLLPAGGTMIDIGANVGLHCIKLARQCDGVRILAFEPLGSTVAFLQANMAKNGISDEIEIHQVALTDHDGEIRMTATLQITNFVIPDSITAATGATEAVPCRRLDDLLAGAVDRVDLIKCDIEGSELGALRGATDTLKRFHPPIFVEIVERYTRRYGHDAATVFAFLRDHGYHHELVIDGRRRPSTGTLADDLAATPNFLFLAD